MSDSTLGGTTAGKQNVRTAGLMEWTPDQREEWMDDAACAQTDPEAFFPEKGGSTYRAKQVCRGCDVVAECLAFALKHEESYGIWGNTSPRERMRMRRAA